MKITKTETNHVRTLRTACRFDIEEVDPIDQVAYKDSGKLMRPTFVEVTVTNGTVGNLHITGIRINKGGADGAPITREWYRYTDAPAWVEALRVAALAAYVAEHGANA